MPATLFTGPAATEEVAHAQTPIIRVWQSEALPYIQCIERQFAHGFHLAMPSTYHLTIDGTTTLKVDAETARAIIDVLTPLTKEIH